MPPCITYWTGTWSPRREAHSIQIEQLRRVNPRPCPVFAHSPAMTTRVRTKERVWQTSSRAWPLYRGLQYLLEPVGNISHAFGSLSAWQLARALGKRPLLFTVTLPGAPSDAGLLDRVALFAAESEALRDQLLDLGVPREKIRLVYPGVDLARFEPSPPPPPSPFRILFASSPAHPGEFEQRGIPLLVEIARHLPDVEILCLWRAWDDPHEAAGALQRLHPPANFIVRRGDVGDMAQVFSGVHATIAAFAPGFGKSCPNSVIEGLACARPALLSEQVGIAELVRRHGAGMKAPRDAAAFVEAIQRLRDGYADYARSARALAESHFSLHGFCRRYAKIYCELAGE